MGWGPLIGLESLEEDETSVSLLPSPSSFSPPFEVQQEECGL